MSWFRWDGDSLKLNIKVQPRARENRVDGVHDDCLRLRLTAPPVDDKANTALVGWLADAFGVPRADVHIARGGTSRTKALEVRSPGRLPDWFGALGGAAGPGG